MKVELKDGYYVDENGKYPRLSYILNLLFPKPPYPPGAAEKGTAIHEWCAVLLKPGRGKRARIEDSGAARPYLENYQKFLEDFNLANSRGRTTEASFIGKFSGGNYGFDRLFHYGCTIDAYFPSKKTIVEIKTGGIGPESGLIDINRDKLQILMQANAIDKNMDLRLILVYVSETGYKTTIVDCDLTKAKNIIIPALICWYSKYGGQLK